LSRRVIIVASQRKRFFVATKRPSFCEALLCDKMATSRMAGFWLRSDMDCPICGMPARWGNHCSRSHASLDRKFKPITIEERFWNRVNKKGINECWEWTGAKRSDGYGTFSMGKRSQFMMAHRYSWMLANGRDIPDGLLVLHNCDNPTCVNPNHLRVGTDADNVRDMWDRNRARTGVLPGELNGMSKLTWDKVREIRTKYSRKLNTYRLSEEYGVSEVMIAKIIRGDNWKEG
jgi:hypothetical protein